MMRMTATGKSVKATINGLAKRIDRGVRSGAFKSGKTLKVDAEREIIAGIKSGRVYRIKDPRTGVRRSHRSSAAGQSHADLSGTLRRSIGYNVKGSKELIFGYGVNPATESKTPRYAKFVEFGTRKMKARPSLQNTLKKSPAQIVKHFNREIAAELNKGGGGNARK